MGSQYGEDRDGYEDPFWYAMVHEQMHEFTSTNISKYGKKVCANDHEASSLQSPSKKLDPA